MTKLALKPIMLDLDNAPLCPNYAQSEKLVGGGSVYCVGGMDIAEHHCGGQRDWLSIRNEISNQRGQTHLNANVLDFLLRNQDLIPASWTGWTLEFRGTIYKREEYGREVRFTRYLYCNGGRWHWRYAQW